MYKIYDDAGYKLQAIKKIPIIDPQFHYFYLF